MKSVTEMRRSAPMRTFVSFPKPLTPVAFCGGVSDRVTSIWCGAYQDLVEMTELQCEMSGTRKEQESTDNENRFVNAGPAAWSVKHQIDRYCEENGITPWREMSNQLSSACRERTVEERLASKAYQGCHVIGDCHD